MTLADLRELYKKTTFAETEDKSEWCDGRGKPSIKISEEKGFGGEPDWTHYWIPECSYFGETQIMSNDGEKHGEDCYFIQELLEYFRVNFQEATSANLGTAEDHGFIRVPISKEEAVLLKVEKRK